MDKIFLYEAVKEIGQKPLRSSIITAAALIDSLLESLIQAYLVKGSEKEKIFEPQGCLGTFSAKISMAYCLGLISKELHDDINLYRKIRNACAHSIYLGEKELADIKSKILNFTLVKQIFKINGEIDLITYSALEFMIILVCFIKRINNIEQLDVYPLESQGTNLAFDEKDYQFIKEYFNIG